MKKLDRKKMEARLQTMMNEPEDISEERMEAIKQRAHDEYLRRMEAQARPSPILCKPPKQGVK